MIVVVSDVHWGYDKSNNEDFLKFLEENKKKKIDYFVILGDLFDFWRKNNAEIISDNDDMLEKLGEFNAKVHYIVGNHDYYIWDLKERCGENYPFEVSKSLRLNDNGNKFYFTHGYEFEVLLSLEPMTLEIYESFSRNMCFSENMVGGIASHLWAFLEKNREIFGHLLDEMNKTPKERGMDSVQEFALTHAKNLLFGIESDETLIFGHTHKPFINKEKKVANTGSWVKESSNEQNSYIEIANGQMELKFFKSH